MQQITITIDAMDAEVSKAELLRELMEIIKECPTNELNRPNNNWHAEYSSVRVRTQPVNA